MTSDNAVTCNDTKPNHSVTSRVVPRPCHVNQYFRAALSDWLQPGVSVNGLRYRVRAKRPEVEFDAVAVDDDDDIGGAGGGGGEVVVQSGENVAAIPIRETAAWPTPSRLATSI